MYEQELQEAVRESLADLPNVNLVYLFGSRVDGWVGPRSDYDLGVVLDRVQDAPQSCMQLCADLRRILGSVHIDMVVLNKAPIELAYAVIAQGKVLYQRDVTTRVEYEAEVMSRYGDYLPVLRAQRQDILQGEVHAARVQRYRAALGRTERTLGQIRATRSQRADGV